MITIHLFRFFYTDKIAFTDVRHAMKCLSCGHKFLVSPTFTDACIDRLNKDWTPELACEIIAETHMDESISILHKQ